jgi:hypothetical protein
MSNSDKKLYVVEFGRPSGNDNWIVISGSRQGPVYVVARTYDEAAQKAIDYLEANTTKQSVLDSDGSLKMNQEELRVNAVKLASDFIIW